MLRVKKCYGDFLEKSIFGGRGSQKTNMKNPFFGGRVHEKPIYRGAWTFCRFEGRLGQEGVVFLGGVDTPMHTMHQSADIIFTAF